MKKKVLVDLFYLNTALTGIKTYICEFYEAVQENHEDELEFVFTHDFNKQLDSKTFKGNINPLAKLFYHFYYFVWKQILLPLAVFRHRPDVLICFDFVVPAIPLNVKKLVVIHDAFFWQMPHNYRSCWRKYFLNLIKWGLNGDSTVITTSRYSKTSLEKEANISKPIKIIYQCPRLLPETSDLKILNQLGLNPKEYFLHVGSFDKRKLLPILVEAFHIYSTTVSAPIKLVLVGERGLSESVDDFENVTKLISNLSLKDQVLLPGFLLDPQVKALYQNALAYVFPSSNEGFGIPAIEAMNSQLPVIISDQEALVEISGDAALVIKTGDVNQWANAMQNIQEDSILREGLIQKGKARRLLFTRKSFYLSFRKLF
jgi:glycosyltransferase involved in cell wall biosynthesis